MIAPDLPTAIARLRELIEEAEAIVPFTGAGISTECGIPDFRSPGGIWTKNQPIPFDEFLSSRRCATRPGAGALPWRSNSPGPNRAAGIWRSRVSIARGKVPGVITQNIDNLHQASGIAAKDVVELHGNTTYATCLDCGERYELSWVRKNSRPRAIAP